MARWRVAPGLVLALGLSGGPSAGAEVLAPPPGAVETARIVAPRDRFALAIGRIDGTGAGIEAREAEVVRTAWVLPQGVSTTAEVLAALRDQLRGGGYEIVWDCVTEACGGFDFRFAVDLIPAPAMRLDVADFGQITARRGDAWVSVLVSRSLGAVHGQVVLLDHGAPAPVPDARSDPAEAVRAELETKGFAVLEGLVFDSAGTNLAADSEPRIAAAAAALRATPGWTVVVVGHSDGVGALEGNVALSRARAEAVRDALIAAGVAPERLSAEGVGFLAPRASNATEAGRALNRRVELVRR